MISVEEALMYISQISLPKLKSVKIATNEALGYVLAQDIIAPFSIPAFRQSAMDGYGVCANESLEYTVVAEVKAGQNDNVALLPGQAVRIFTGAKVPDDVTDVVIQEKVIRNGTQISIESLPPKELFIRNIGDQIQEGQVALQQGQTLNPSALGLVLSMGFEQIEVFEVPKVSIVLTGNELVEVGNELKSGEIFESNSLVLKSALWQKGICDAPILFAKDTLESTISAIKKALEKSDLVLISGGISVGDYDFVAQALETLGIQTHFYKIKQKPGKPLLFGGKETKFVFALPGNPASTLTCFYVYVNSFLDRMMGKNEQGLKRIMLPMAHEYVKNSDRAEFLKAYFDLDGVRFLNAQNSAMIISFAAANCLVYIPAEKKLINKNEKVEVVILPSYN